jgi:hypothetical protein
VTAAAQNPRPFNTPVVSRTVLRDLPLASPILSGCHAARPKEVRNQTVQTIQTVQTVQTVFFSPSPLGPEGQRGA